MSARKPSTVPSLVESLHARLDADVETWKGQLRALVARGVPSDQSHAEFARIASLAAMVQAAPVLHALYDELASEGVIDTTPLTEQQPSENPLTSKAARRLATLDETAAELTLARTELEAEEPPTRTTRERLSELTRAEALVRAQREHWEAQLQEALGK
jgi:hypothetical protein